MGRAKETPVHVLINNPNDIRRHLLLGGIDAIKVLERYEYFKKLKNSKKKYFLHLNEKLKSIKQEIDRLTNLLPRVTEEKIEKQVSRIEVKRDVPIERGHKKVDTKTRDLRREISEIQQKLSKLNF
jgi:hypothetical protein